MYRTLRYLPYAKHLRRTIINRSSIFNTYVVERCDLVGVKVEEFTKEEEFKFFIFVGKEWRNYMT